ncbi:hypothetical protein J2848_005622 [Azospirillum lipoferum]|uniref:Uncharacterized protein n=1 Tax=Azospirillum lipoferum TaxID=193 RepID=A0A5A9GFB7_AZOLI|nr:MULTISPECIES: hypothetical protein [Azospirillum]KAA0593017.1 hypothetical protein FZ942_26200 [Azospirillum lipoferum]MCP1613921.1 hypothetical protein [Azospirillum lipoferum]MDW5537684.1 hypothetical protein [Azospirillum sp. NL1]
MAKAAVFARQPRLFIDRIPLPAAKSGRRVCSTRFRGQLVQGPERHRRSGPHIGCWRGGAGKSVEASAPIITPRQ